MFFGKDDRLGGFEMLPGLVEVAALELNRGEIVVDGGVFGIHLNVFFKDRKGLFLPSELQPGGRKMEDPLPELGTILNDLF